MKEKKQSKKTLDKLAMPVLSVEELKEKSTYFSNKNEIVMIKNIYWASNEIYLFNISENFHQLLSLDRHGLVKKIR